MELKVPRKYWERLNEKYSLWYNSYDISDKLSIDSRSYHPDSDSDIEFIANKILQFENSI